VAADRARGDFVEPKATDEELHRIPDADEEAELAEDVRGAEEMFVQPFAQLPVTEATLEALDTEEAGTEALAERQEGEDGEPEFPELFGDEVEPELDEHFRRRTAVGLETEPAVYGPRRETEQLPAGPGRHEFVCSTCHLVRRRTQLADPVHVVCRDCAQPVSAHEVTQAHQ
jgi:hypothetical protein